MPSTPALASLTAASAILDLANGLDEDKSVLTGMFAFELAREAGHAADVQRASFYAAMLRQLGCTAYAEVEGKIATDDLAMRAELMRRDPARPGGILAAISAGNPTLVAKAIHTAWLATHARRVRAEWTSEACGAARTLAEQLGLPADVARALDETFEQFDGGGAPRGLRGSEISAPARIVTAAHSAVVALIDGGIDLAADVIAARVGHSIDPALARHARALLVRFADPGADELTARIAEIERVLGEAPCIASPKVVAVCFGDFADLQTRFSRGHSRNVAGVVVRAAAELGLTAEESADLEIAAHLHDLGHVAVPAAIWLRRSWDAAARARANAHPFFTERILANAPAFAEAAKIAGAHHERLDGSGYHRALRDTTLSRAARLLAVADVATALGEPRPHRPAVGRDAARQVLIGAARAGELDRECVELVLALSGEPIRRSSTSAILGLTDRERDVLRQLALGQTNKQIAVSLGISDRTVQHHTIGIYRKLGVDTRAAATLLASRHGLV